MKLRVFATMVALAVLLTGCESKTVQAAPAPVAIDPAKEPLKAYAQELRVQYDLVVGSLTPGQMTQSDIDAFVASWVRLSNVYYGAKNEYDDLTDRAKANFVNDNFKYPWFSDSGFLGTAISKETGELLQAEQSATLFLTRRWHSPTGEFLDIGSINEVLGAVASDLDPILSKSQKKAIAQPLAEAVLACFPDKKWTYKKLYLKNETGYIAAPYPRDWF